MKQSQTKKVYIYPIKDTDGTPLDLIIVLTHVSSTGVSNASGELNSSSRWAKEEKLVLDRVDTFIGHTNRGEYIKVGSTENLSAPGVIFRYASYVREQEALLGYYLDCYHENLKGLVYTEKGAYYLANWRDAEKKSASGCRASACGF